MSFLQALMSKNARLCTLPALPLQQQNNNINSNNTNWCFPMFHHQKPIWVGVDVSRHGALTTKSSQQTKENVIYTGDGRGFSGIRAKRAKRKKIKNKSVAEENGEWKTVSGFFFFLPEKQFPKVIFILYRCRKALGSLHIPQVAFI